MMSLYVPKQHGQVQEVAMEVMQMDQIGPEPVHLFQKPPRRDRREAPLQAAEISQPVVHTKSKIRADQIIASTDGGATGRPACSNSWQSSVRAGRLPAASAAACIP